MFAAAYALLRDEPAEAQPYERFAEDATAYVVARVEVNDGGFEVETRANQRYRVVAAIDPEELRLLYEGGADLEFRHGGPALSRIGGVVGAILILGAAIYLFRRRTGSSAATGMLSLLRSRAREATPTEKVHFSDVGGAESAKEELGDIIDFLRQPERWRKAGAQLPRGVLLEGPPGCGKTLLARAAAGEAGVPFFVVSGSEFVEMFIGVGAARVRDTFEKAKQKAPCIVFIDELDAVGRRRGSGIGSAHDEREQTLNQLLVSLDGFTREDAVVVIAATNRSDVLDKALTRPGRLDRRIRVDPPDAKARAATLAIHSRGKPLAPSVDLAALAARVEGWTGAMLAVLANEAALLAVRRARGGDEVLIRPEDFERAIAKLSAEERRFDKVDTLLIESASQLAQPTGRSVVRLGLRGGERIEGELVWADASFVKLRCAGGDLVVPKARIDRVEALAGTEDETGTPADAWAHRMPETG